MVLMDLYSMVGDQLALQYGGSEAHKKVGGGGNSSRPVTNSKHKELLTSIRRYYSNAFTDRVKQDAMNVFLGTFVASEHTVHASPLRPLVRSLVPSFTLPSPSLSLLASASAFHPFCPPRLPHACSLCAWLWLIRCPCGRWRTTTISTTSTSRTGPCSP